MKTIYITLIFSFGIMLNMYSQTVPFRFDVDGIEFLSIRKSVNDVKTIHQSSLQTSMYFGYESGINSYDDNSFSANHGNTAFGHSAMSSQKTGGLNTAYGYRALFNLTTAHSNIGIGPFALVSNKTGYDNIAIGRSSMRSVEEDGYNISIGTESFYNAKNINNSLAIGHAAGSNDTSSVDNVYIGSGAGRGTIFATDGYNRSNNVMLGSYSGYSCITSGNVFIGSHSGKFAKVDNQLYISNSSTDSLNSLIYGQFDNGLLRVNGELMIDGLYTLPTTAPSVGDYMTHTGAGELAWSDIPWKYGTGTDVIYDSGNVGIGVSDAQHLLHVSENASNFLVKFHNTSTSATSKGVVVQNGPNTNPGTSVKYLAFKDGNGSNLGAISGNGSGGVQYGTVSDRRLKQNIKTFSHGIETVNKIRPARYEMISNPNVEEIGFIAQELQKILPIAVSGSPSDNPALSPMTVDYSRVTPVLVAAIQEQQVLIQKLMNRLDENESLIKALKYQQSKLLKAKQ